SVAPNPPSSSPGVLLTNYGPNLSRERLNPLKTHRRHVGSSLAAQQSPYYFLSLHAPHDTKGLSLFHN
ncbi:hypothetical protein BT69DRAFT_1284991, partial [Atractiella rhizophila]